MTAASDIDPNLVAEAARAALEKAGGDVRAATSAFELAVRKDRALKDALFEPRLRNACSDAIRQACITASITGGEPRTMPPKTAPSRRPAG